MLITPLYSCPECSFYLHKSCAELPQEKTHPLHPDHTLTLLPKLQQDGSCHCCGSDLENFTYNYSPCEFDVDIERASLKDNSFGHPIHEYPLTVTKKQALFECDGCGIEHKGTKAKWTKFKVDLDHPGIVQVPVSDELVSLVNHFRQGKGERNKRCIRKCGFFIHMSCAELPSEVQHPGHPGHPLVLSPKYPTPFGLFRCKGCNKFGNGLIYSCAECEDYKLDMICGSLLESIQHEAHKQLIKPNLPRRCRASDITECDTAGTCTLAEGQLLYLNAWSAILSSTEDVDWQMAKINVS